jgi:hypothetical protein
MRRSVSWRLGRGAKGLSRLERGGWLQFGCRFLDLSVFSPWGQIGFPSASSEGAASRSPSTGSALRSGLSVSSGWAADLPNALSLALLDSSGCVVARKLLFSFLVC